MSDVWRELMERLKQKAFERYELPEWVLRRHKWVRLEDVLETLKELKQNYVLIPKKKLMEKLAEIKLYGTKINGQLSDKPEYSPRYLADFIEKELLRKNEG